MELRIENLSVELSGKKILKHIDLSVAKGDFLSLLGPSGCGKSTLLKTISGIIPQYTGSVLMGGNPVDRLPPHKRGAVIVFQDMRLFPHMSAAENVGFPLRMRGVPRKEYIKIVSELLKRVQLEGLENRTPNKLSGGQQQRVALARALAAKPNVLLLDEPFSGLDENLRNEMRELVLHLHRSEGMTTILVSHDKNEALGMSDAIALLSEGRILQTGTPKDLYERPKSRKAAEYLGEASFIQGEVMGGKFTSPIFVCNTSLADGKYTAVVRPSSVKLDGGDEFLLTRSNYRGDKAEALFLHEQSGQEVKCELRTDCMPRAGDRSGLRIDTDKIVLVKE